MSSCATGRSLLASGGGASGGGLPVRYNVVCSSVDDATRGEGLVRITEIIDLLKRRWLVIAVATVIVAIVPSIL
ncbi:MAG: hypothetical protein Q8K89_08410, partial [Actinomycetota bacterium]|nr:hypothetical protein [Actinomycetota bacterium]